MWLLLAACHPDPPASPGTPPPTGDTGSPPPIVDTVETADTAGPPGSTGDTGAPPAGGDPFLSGDPADLIALFELVWSPDSPQWAVVGTTFRPGSWRWSGTVAVAPSGVDACEVRTDDPEIQAQLENFGAVDLYSSGDHVWTTSPAPGVYLGLEDMADIDVRGRTWDFQVEGSYVPFFELPAAITFPPGELAVTGPTDGAAVAAGAPLEVRWSGTATDLVEISLLGADGSRVRCAATDDGAFDVEPALLAWLPPGEVSWGVYAREMAGPAGGGGWVQLYATHAVEGRIVLQQ